MNYKLFSKVLSATALFSFFSLQTNAQGCADAGLCSIGPMKSSEFFEEPTNGEIRFRPSYGLGEKQVSNIGLQLEGDYNIQDVVYFQFILPYNINVGDLGSATGFGDLTLSLSAPVYKGDEVATTIFVGTKIPLQNGNALDDNGNSLPMAYQPSLGTYDILGGVAVSYKQFLFSAGYQQPLTQNENGYVAPGVDPDEESWTTNGFERSADLALRAEYSKDNPEKINWKAGLLGIVHMGNDSYLDPEDNTRKDIENSSGLTLNITGGISKSFGKYTLGTDLGFPVVTREARPDGLTRSFVLGVYGGWKF